MTFAQRLRMTVIAMLALAVAALIITSLAAAGRTLSAPGTRAPDEWNACLTAHGHGPTDAPAAHDDPAVGPALEAAGVCRALTTP